MSDSKDRFGDKLHDVEKAREDQWARDQDRRLIEKLHQKQAPELHCPRCNAKLTARVQGGIAMLACPDDHGAWLDQQTLQQLEKR
jgi:hypothetical protein